MLSVIIKPDGVSVDDSETKQVLVPDVLLIELEDGNYVDIIDVVEVLHKYYRLNEIIL